MEPPQRDLAVDLSWRLHVADEFLAATTQPLPPDERFIPGHRLPIQHLRVFASARVHRLDDALVQLGDLVQQFPTARLLDNPIGVGRLGSDNPLCPVSFTREASPETVFTIQYDTRKGLESRGVQFKRPVYVAPSAFPAQSGYCEPPEGWHK